MEINLNQILTTKEDENTYLIIYNGITYSFEMTCKNESLEIKVKRKLSRAIFKGIFVFNDFILMDPYFYSYRDVSRIFETIKMKLLSQKFEIREEKNVFSLKLIFEIDSQKQIAEIKIENKGDENNLTELFDDHSFVINSLIEKNNLLAKENSEIKTMFKILEERVSYLENDRIKILDKIILNQLENKDNELINKIFFINSKIVLETEVSTILGWIDSNNLNTLKTTLLYNSKRDSSKTDDIFKFCGNKGSTISFVKTTTGKRFGSYTTLSWGSSGISKGNDELGFTFTLDRMKKFAAKKRNKDTGDEKNNVSYGFDIFLSNIIGDDGAYSQFTSNYLCDDSEYLLGNKNEKIKFVVEILEIYGVSK